MFKFVLVGLQLVVLVQIVKEGPSNERRTMVDK